MQCSSAMSTVHRAVDTAQRSSRGGGGGDGIQISFTNSTMEWEVSLESCGMMQGTRK
jgi:hypothetical protein